MAIMAAGQERIHVVETSSLAREEGRSRKDLYKEDGIHLTPKGTYILETSFILAMHKEKPGLRTQQVHRERERERFIHLVMGHLQIFGQRGPDKLNMAKFTGIHML